MKYWFRQKSFGYGATPSTWQGWMLTVASLLLVIVLIYAAPHVRDNASRAALLAIGIPLVLVPFTWIAWRKTEGGWHGRSGRD